MVFRCVYFFFTDAATSEIYTYWHTLSLHDALPIYVVGRRVDEGAHQGDGSGGVGHLALVRRLRPHQPGEIARGFLVAGEGIAAEAPAERGARGGRRFKPVVEAVGPGRKRRGQRRSEERRVGKECVRTCRSRWRPSHYKTNNYKSQY